MVTSSKAMASHGQPWMAMPGHCEPWPAIASHGRPFWFKRRINTVLALCLTYFSSCDFAVLIGKLFQKCESLIHAGTSSGCSALNLEAASRYIARCSLPWLKRTGRLLTVTMFRAENEIKTEQGSLYLDQQKTGDIIASHCCALLITKPG